MQDWINPGAYISWYLQGHDIQNIVSRVPSTNYVQNHVNMTH